MISLYVNLALIIVGVLVIIFYRALGNLYYKFNLKIFEMHPWLKQIQRIRYKHRHNRKFWYDNMVAIGILMILFGLFMLYLDFK